MSFTFTIDKNKIRSEKRLSQTKNLYNFNWCVEAVIFIHQTEEYLVISLKCEGPDETIKKSISDNWCHAASYTVKCNQYGDKDLPIEFKLKPYAFDKDHMIYKHSKVSIPWKCIFLERKENVDFDISIEMSNPADKRSVLVLKSNPKNCNDSCVSSFELQIFNVKNLMAVKSQEFTINDKKFYFCVYKYEDHLDVSLLTYSNDHSPIEWTQRMFVKLVSNKGPQYSIEKLEMLRNTKNFVSWSELTNLGNGFITNKSIKIEVSIVSFINFHHVKSILQALTLDVSQVRFRMEIPNIEQRISYRSPEIRIRGFPWEVQFGKRIENGKIYFVACLSCNVMPRPSKFPLVASSSIKVIPFNEQVEAIEHHNVPAVFDHATSCHGEPITEWSHLFDDDKFYVENNTIQLEVGIAATRPNNLNQSKITLSYAKNAYEFSVTISNVQSLVAVKTPNFDVGRHSWSLGAHKYKGYLGVVFYFFGPTNCTRTTSVKLLSKHSSQKQYFRPNDKCVHRLISWDDLLEPGNYFVHNDCITLGIEIEDVLKMNCTI